MTEEIEEGYQDYRICKKCGAEVTVFNLRAKNGVPVISLKASIVHITAKRHAVTLTYTLTYN